MLRRVESPGVTPTGAEGEDKQEGPLPGPMKRQEAALNRHSIPVRLVVGHPLYTSETYVRIVDREP